MTSPLEMPAAAPGRAAGAGARAPNRRILQTGLGVFVALAVVGLLATHTRQAWLLGSFGATSVLLFGFPDVPFSRPRNVIGGHVLASAVGLLFLQLCGPGWLPMAAAGACAAMLMIWTDTVHPPAGSNPVIVFMALPDWSFLLLPTLAGACSLVAISWMYQRLARAGR